MKVVRRRLDAELNIGQLSSVVASNERLKAIKSKLFCIFLSMNRTTGNFFYTFYTKGGNVLSKISAGMSGLDGPQMLSDLSAELCAKMVVDKLVLHPHMKNLSQILQEFKPYYTLPRRKRKFYVFRTRFPFFLRRLGRRLLSRKKVGKLFFYLKYKLAARFPSLANKEELSLFSFIKTLKKITRMRRRIFFKKFFELEKHVKKELLFSGFRNLVRPRFFRWKRKARERMFFRRLRAQRRRNRYIKPKPFRRKRVKYQKRRMLIFKIRRFNASRVSLRAQRSFFYAKYLAVLHNRFIDYVYHGARRRSYIRNDFLERFSGFFIDKDRVKHNKVQKKNVHIARRRRQFYRWKPYRIPDRYKFKKKYPLRRWHFFPKNLYRALRRYFFFNVPRKGLNKFLERKLRLRFGKFRARILYSTPKAYLRNRFYLAIKKLKNKFKKKTLRLKRKRRKLLMGNTHGKTLFKIFPYFVLVLRSKPSFYVSTGLREIVKHVPIFAKFFAAVRLPHNGIRSRKVRRM